MKRLQWVVVPAGLVALAAAIAYFAYLESRPGGDMLVGVVNLYQAADPTLPYTSGGCTANEEGAGEFADLKRGAVVKVSDETGELLSVTGLSRGSDTLQVCTFAFTAGPLPA